MLHNNWIALAITLALSIIWLRVNDFAAHKGWISGELSRKIIHMGTGPIFVLCWLLFDDASYARYLAALIPLAITIQFALVGSGVIKDASAVEAMSRTGNRKEILRGPLYYGIVFVILTIVFWKNSPNGIVALMLLCGGDGLADVLGKRLESLPLPWSHSKSWAGSLAMFLGGLIFAAAILAVYVNLHIFPGMITSYLPGLLVIAAVGTLVESMPFKDIDNLTVPISALLLGWWLL
jgi:phytol kinase